MMLRPLEEVWQEWTEEARQWLQVWPLRLPGSWRLRPIQVTLGAVMDALELVRGVCDKVGWAELSEGTSDSCLCPPPRSSTIVSWAEAQASWVLKQLCKLFLSTHSYAAR